MKIILATAIVKKCLNVWNTQELAQNCKSHISIYLSIYLSTLSICIIHINIYTYIYTCINIYMIYIYIKYLTYITHTYTHTGIFVDADIYVL